MQVQIESFSNAVTIISTHANLGKLYKSHIKHVAVHACATDQEGSPHQNRKQWKAPSFGRQLKTSNFSWTTDYLCNEKSESRQTICIKGLFFINVGPMIDSIRDCACRHAHHVWNRASCTTIKCKSWRGESDGSKWVRLLATAMSSEPFFPQDRKIARQLYFCSPNPNKLVQLRTTEICSTFLSWKSQHIWI